MTAQRPDSAPTHSTLVQAWPGLVSIHGICAVRAMVSASPLFTGRMSCGNDMRSLPSKSVRPGRLSLAHAAGGKIPVEDLLAVPQHDAGGAGDALEHLLQVADAKRRAADVGMDGDRHHPGGVRTLLQQPLEAVDGA